MSLPRKDYSGQKASLTVTEFRAEPGEVLDRVAHGMTVEITKNGRHVATLIPPPTVIDRKGNWTGARPLMMGVTP